MNGGTRTVQDGVYRCVCPERYGGEFCQACKSFTAKSHLLIVTHVRVIQGKSRFSFRMRGGPTILSLIARPSLTNELQHYYYGFCRGDPGHFFATLFMIKSGIVIAYSRSRDINVHCDTSGFDSYWIEFNKDGVFQLGVSGDPTPIAEILGRENEVLKKIGILPETDLGTEWMIDLPCRGS
ncbi:uncharacterized protein LOC121429163 [Lytechinus variegatus]|uniref:uncharacterized protein LOC121429163 n=1 Tax=Lytechinus variegatus TaxID=7654 RepID=UPI001BB2B4E6|nr:uncharacterized protein LOC121429163 [Lytechinus variegatus]